ncbi:hypothetical protein VTJ04DRAFT_3226 [Mycothermus thermophilus]|uniref:uncharacterized protein n=1 Tax=Humicola insolens TaxID=85995 RepID=UPI003743BA44
MSERKKSPAGTKQKHPVPTGALESSETSGARLGHRPITGLSSQVHQQVVNNLEGLRHNDVSLETENPKNWIKPCVLEVPDSGRSDRDRPRLLCFQGGSTASGGS